MIVRLADEQDAPGLIELARQVEDWFGPMAGDPGFRVALDRHIGRATALVAVNAGQAGLLGGLLFSAKPPAYHVRWLVVSELARREGVGRALMAEGMRRFVCGPGVMEVVTFGPGTLARWRAECGSFMSGLDSPRPTPQRPARRRLPPSLPKAHRR